MSLLESLKELIEICRFKCGPFDEIILRNGKSNQQALIDAITLVEQAEIKPFQTVTIRMGLDSWVLKSNTGQIYNIPVEYKNLFSLFVDKIKAGAAGERVAWNRLNATLDIQNQTAASEKLRKAKFILNTAMRKWGRPIDKGDWFTRTSHGYALNASCAWKVY
jgi:hypothetical protein